MACFGTVVGQAVAKGFAFAAWEDGGDFKFFNRNEHSWTELKDLLIYGSEKAPYKINISVIDGNVKLQWQNRFTPTGKIVVQRMTDGGIFADYTELANTATEYIDTQSEAGKTFYYRLRFTDGTTEVQSYPVRIAVVPTVRSPFSGSAISIPGTIEAENYDIGGEGLTYHDTEAANQGKEYRLNDGVDVGKHADNAYHVGYGAVGEWIEYTIDVKKAGVYNVTAYVAGPSAGGEFSLQFNGGTKTSFQTPATGDWVIYQTIKKTVSLELGEQIMRFNIDKTGFDIDKLVFSQVSGIDKSSKTAIEFFPNPASKTLNIRGFTSNTNLKIYNSVGKLCENLQIESPEASISVENLCNGVYFVNYTINEQNFSSQISIQH
jgi:hypothetical protein